MGIIPDNYYTASVHHYMGACCKCEELLLLLQLYR